ncbi:MAG TPA: PASTA domain-containing protein [Prolixibacteraceae bacterium]|nr:PASTA domain-containing protein [Prolixibacteraceae bacterium]
MSFSKFLTSRKFLINLLLAVFILALLIFLVMQGLKMYTRHGEANPVPDFTGLTLNEARETAKQHDLNLQIIDSLYANDFAPGAVVDQVPEKNHRVKTNRTVFITINSTGSEMVSLPRLTNISFRQAQVLVENSGLEIGQISYKPSEYNDLVLNVQIDSVDVLAGDKLAKGASIDLVVGRTQGNMDTPLPDITGLTIEQADQALTNAMLNTGVLIYDESILSQQDSVNAIVWQQRPSPKITGNVNLGSSVDLWVTVDQLKIEDAMQQDF